MASSAGQAAERGITLIGGSHSVALTQEIADILGVQAYFPSSEFPDGELAIKLPESVRGHDVFAVQSHNRTVRPDGSERSVNDAIMEHVLIMDAARRASSARREAFAPYMGYARQDRKTQGRTPISAAVVANMLVDHGATGLCAVDLHSGQIQGNIKVPFDHLVAEDIFAHEVQRLREESPDSNGWVMVSPDLGHAGVVYNFAKIFNGEVGSAHVAKRRSGSNVSTLGIEGDDVVGKDCILYDDMISTGGTMVVASRALLDAGAASVRIFATHGVFSGNAPEILANAGIKEIVVTNTIDPGEDPRLRGLNIRRLSVAPLLANAILEIHNDGSISSLFNGHNNV